MVKLGSTPTERYYLSWVTQRMVNRAPEISHARQAPASVAKQIMNPIAQDIQRMNQEIIEERDNIMPSLANIDLLSEVYEVDLQPSISFSYTENTDGSVLYDTPRVYASIDNTEYEITQAHRNNIETFAYNTLPSRVEDGETAYAYLPVIPTTSVSLLGDSTPNDLPIEAHLYITIAGNTNWETRVGTTVYYPKAFITGVTRKGTYETEAIPLRYNGTFKTVNQWAQVSEFFVSYLDSDANISVDVFPWLADGLLDARNLSIDTAGQEKWRFINMRTHTWGNSFISESFTTNDFELIRKGIEAKDIEHELELLDDSDANVTFDAFAMKPYTDYMYAISGDKFYVYDTKLPYPEVTRLEGESPDVKMDLMADKWIFARGETASIKTRILDFENVPVKTRWTLQTPSLNEYYMGLDGSLWPTTTDAWIDNARWDEDLWLEQNIDFVLSESGTYIISIECMYYDEDSAESTILETKYLFYTPSITPEVVLDMPATITDVSDMSFDSDGKLWVESNSDIQLLNVYYDYFMADYSRDKLYLKEQYASIRIEV